MKKTRKNLVHNNSDPVTDIIVGKYKFDLGRMIAFSKSTYISKRPNNQAVFNANVVTREGKIWWGDLDLAEDSEKLQAIADDLNSTLYILREMDYRLDRENLPFNKVEKLSIKTFVPSSQQHPQKKVI